MQLPSDSEREKPRGLELRAEVAQGHFWGGWLSLVCPVGVCEWHQQSPEGRFWLTPSR